MPPIFKALATIMVWVLFVASLFIVFTTFLFGILEGVLFVAGKTVPIFYPIMWTLAGAFGILSVVGMKLRKMLE